MNASLVPMLTLFACLSEIETGNNDHKIGRVGEVSRYQIRPEVWRDFSTFPLWKARWSPAISADIARRIQSRNVDTFRRVWLREPTVREWYALWNAPSQAYRGKLSKTVAERAKRFENLVLASGRPAQ